MSIFQSTHRFRVTIPTLGLSLLLLCMLSACSLVSMGEPAAKMQLHPALPGSMAASKQSLNTQLIVSLPQSTRDMGGDGIALVFSGREVRHLEGYRWASSSPELLQRSFIDALSSTGAFAAVADELSGLSSVIRLQSEIRQFALFYPSEHSLPTAVFQVRFRLVNLAVGIEIASIEIRTEAPAASGSPTDLVLACERAVAEANRQLATWAIASVK